MRIAFDLHGIQSEGSRTRGIGRYSLEIIKNIIKGFPEHDIILVVNATLSDLKTEFQEYFNYKNVTYLKWHSPCPFDFISGNKRTRKFAKYLKSYTYSCINADVILITSFFEGYSDNCFVDFDNDFIKIPIISIFYDLIPLINPDLYLKNNPGFKKFYKARLKKLKKLDGLLAISNSAAQEATKYLSISSNKVFNISSACDKKVFDKNSDISSFITINVHDFSPFILYSGAIDPRKNVESLLQAFSQLPDQLDHFKLVLVGKFLELEDEQLDNWIQAYKIDPHRVVKTGYVSDFDLVELYRKCSLFVFPSLHEGFGLPVLEAMACGAPVIGSNCTSIPEVIGLDCAMFDPKKVHDMKNLIIKALTNKHFNDELRSNSLVQSQKFSWSITALEIIKACQSIIQKKALKPKQYEWEYLLKQKENNLNLLLKKIRKMTIFKIIKEDDLFSQLAASIDKITIQLDSLIRELSNKDERLSWRVEGPFDSSYSLAILNRSFAKALDAKIDQISIHVTEGLGDYFPDINYLKKYSQLYTLYKESLDSSVKSIVQSRNLYPPRVNDMNAKFNILHSYGWEESELPSIWISDFNSYLQGITVMSSQVKKILIDNGICLPIKVTALGLDHINDTKNNTDFHVNAKNFKILHISSCFPRKGIDILLQAFGDNFTKDDDISLIIKTFDNPHNKIDKLLRDFRNKYPLYPEVILIKKELDDDEVKSLYLQSDVLVAPSRGEGFGLPIAEAMLLGIPVITTNWGGQLDFCDQKNSWLVDYEFVSSNSHFNLDLSYWVEPSIKDLGIKMLEVFHASQAEIKIRTTLAKESISNLKWGQVADFNITFIKDTLSKYINLPLRIGWVTTWNTRCGIASYSKHLIEYFFNEVYLFTPSTEQPKKEIEKNIFPSWSIDSDIFKDYKQLEQEVLAKGISTLVIQFNYGLYNFPKFSDFIEKIIASHINVIIFMHATIDPPNLPLKRLNLLKDALTKCQRVFVHTIDDLNRLKDIGLINNVSLFPHGILDFENKNYNNISKNSTKNKDNSKKIATFGFCLPNKGFRELIQAIKLLKDQNFQVNLQILAAIYDEDSYEFYEELQSLIHDLSLEHIVHIDQEYKTDDDILSELSKNDLIIFPYQASNESSSASVRHGLATSKPVLVTPINIFNDVSTIVDFLPGCTSENIANGIYDWFEKDQKNLILDKSHIIDKRRFSKLSNRLLSIIESLEINRESGN
tara:strand:+ start:9814 stop:13461 length:3648 start_codon:yes stop_codon:yes gene_type:complete